MLMKKKETPKRSEGEPTPTPTPPNNAKNARRPPSTAQTKKAKLTPMKPLDQSEDDISSADKEEFLMLEIKQLKRQNNFLKKKIIDLTAQFGPDKPRPKKGKEKQKQKGSLQNLQSMPLSINLFFEEIHNLLNTIVKLFRINFTPEEIAAYEEKQNAEMQETCPIRKHALLKKYLLKRKLERILLENEEKRFPLVLDLFTQYYEFKEESDMKIINTIDSMTSKAHQLNQWIIQKAQQRKKSRTTFSTIRKDDQIIPIQPLRLPTSPRNLVNNPKTFTYSPAAARNTKKATKFAMSPAQRIKKPNDF